MMLIFVNTFDLNKKESYEKGVKSNNNNHLRLHEICLGSILEIWEVLEQIYQTISVVIIFKFE
ncbi:hypothetical protein YC2023_048324 [Brassica napus]